MKEASNNDTTAPSSLSAKPAMATVILGGGIIGLSTAYYLSLSTNQKIYIVDSSSELLASASGYAGGFLAEDWFSAPVASLGALSFKLHRELAREHDGMRRWGYSGSHVFSLSVNGKAASGKGKAGENGHGWYRDGGSRAQVASGKVKGEMLNDDGSPAVWTEQPGGSLETIGTPESCGQVEPRELCEFLIQQCEDRGVLFLLDTKATNVVQGDDGQFQGLGTVSMGPHGGKPTFVSCKNVVISAGAWAPSVYAELFPQSKWTVPIEPLAGHSLVVKSPRYKTPFIDPGKRDFKYRKDEWMSYAIYCAPGQHWDYACEAFARLARNGETEVWVGGLNDSTLPLPQVATKAKDLIDKEAIEDLRKTTVQLTGLSKEGERLHENDLETIREGLCFRPISQRGTPLIGKVPEDKLSISMGDGGIYIASGHGVWGITLSLGTGKVMSELLLGLKTSANISALRVT
jgi:glycine/D-amino acid oxidase-like deaminating enzyme